MDTNTNGKANSKDPLQHNGPNASRELFNRLSIEANGFPSDAVVLASANMLMNALRQAHATRAAADAAFDELFGQMKQTLLDHYDGTGARKNIFPCNQRIEVPFIKASKPM